MSTPVRQLSKGIGEAVAKRTILRQEDGKLETWQDVARRVAVGNANLIDYKDKEELIKENSDLYTHIANGNILMSGRHLQHGDRSQKNRNLEIYTNCSTSSSSFLLFYLLLNGSGVGRSYDDSLIITDWANNLPNIRTVLDISHPDFNHMTMESVDQANKKYKDPIWFEVPDTREGWGSAVEVLETLTFKGDSKDKTLVIDFSKVRPNGAPIHGMQKRPASGPTPLMKSFNDISTIKNSGMKPWEATMWVDHYLAECILFGGTRRSARIATKSWRDKDILDFIKIKKGGFLWSANNSIMVDQDFWLQDTYLKKNILEEILKAGYFDNTGEPGIINQDKLVQKDEGLEVYKDGNIGSNMKYRLTYEGESYLRKISKVALEQKYSQITNPCGEITLHMLGGYCVIADVVPYFASSDEEAESAFRTATKALIRTNTMPSLYQKEVERTNRIGVGMTGIHEYAWNRFKLGFRDLIDENKSKEFWMMLSRFKKAVDDEAVSYSKKLGVKPPHTTTTIKPAGTTSKLFSLSEGAHLPSMKEYLRWVQFRDDDPIVKEYADKGYPTRKLKTYKNSTIVGFPTRPEICRLGMGDKLVTAGEATPEEQYKWLMLIEKYWINGVDENGSGLDNETGNQVSYTLKYDPKKVDFKHYSDMVKHYQSKVRCCSVMPQVETTAYEYQPEQPITRSYYNQLIKNIEDTLLTEDVDFVHVDCDSGACPVDFYKDN